MSYFVLARKYRPQSFEDLIGQEPVARTLVNALSQGKVAHAYLFSGPRGIGKTTTARLLARALNCEKGPTPKPCGLCAACKEIASGASMEDVLEIDAASNRGIDDIRDLRENVKYAPVRSRYRIYIIDEAHQITKEGFNALLKTLEEPPSHAVFMLATTESQKMPATILSRCQRFGLRPITSPSMVQRLEWIVKQEGLKVERSALEEIVKAAGGSMRDGLSLLDQVVMFAPQGARQDAVRELLGFLPRETVDSFTTVLKSGDPKAIIAQVIEYLEKGGDLSQLARDLQDRYHLVLQAKAGVEDFPGENPEDLAQQAQSYTFDELERNVRGLGRCMDEMKRSPFPQAIFEVFCLRLSQPGIDTASLLRRVETLEKKLASSGAPASYSVSGPPSGAPAASPKVSSTSSFQKPAPISSLPPSSAPKKDPQASASLPSSSRVTLEPPEAETPAATSVAAPVQVKSIGIDDEQLRAHWPFVVQEVHKGKPSLGASLEDAEVRLTVDGALHLVFSTSFNMEQVKRKQDGLSTVLWDRLGKKLALIFSVDAARQRQKTIKFEVAGESFRNEEGVEEIVNKEVAPASQAPERFSVEGEVSSGDLPPVENDPWIKKVLGHFPGELEPTDFGSDKP